MDFDQKNFMELILNGPRVNNAIKSFAFSRSFTKVMMMSSFVNIAYNRLNIDELEVRQHKFQEIPFMGLRRKTPKDLRLKLFLKMRRGIYEAIDKNHVKNEVVESYIFKIKYNTNRAFPVKSNTIQHKDSIIALLELFLELGKNKKLNHKVKIEMELEYYDDTPKNYEPPGFVPSTDPYYLRIDSKQHKLAKINTGFHYLKCYGIGEVFNKRLNCKKATGAVATISYREPGEVIVEESQDEVEPNRKKARLENIDGPIKTIIISDDEWDKQSITASSQCFCGIDKVPEYVGTIACSVCCDVFHKPCHGLIIPDPDKEMKFQCNGCNTNDTLLKSIQRDQYSVIGKIRLLIYVLYKTKKLDAEILNEIPEDVKNAIMGSIYNSQSYTIDADTEEKLYDSIAMERLLKTLFPDEDISQFLTL